MADIIIDSPEQGMLRLTLEVPGTPSRHKMIPWQGHVDNVLLTEIDNLILDASIPKSALQNVRSGQGIDKNSSLYRIVQSLAAAVAATRRTAQ